MKVLYDIHHTGLRYMSNADREFEAALLGLSPKCTIDVLAEEIHRRGLDDFSLGRAVRGASA